MTGITASIKVAYWNGGTGTTYVDANYASLCTYNPQRVKQYALKDNQTGLMIVSEEVKEMYESFGNDKYAFAYAMLGFEENFNWEESGRLSEAGKFVGIIGICHDCEESDLNYIKEDDGSYSLYMTECEQMVFDEVKDSDKNGLLEKYNEIGEAKDTKAKQKALDEFREILSKRPTSTDIKQDRALEKAALDDILPEALKKERIYSVGRLDYDTKGVLVLTNDGEFMNAMVGPKSGIEKEYLVRAKGILTMTDVKKLTEGIVINGKKTLPAVVTIESLDREHGSSLVRIIITEGNYHQVKEMFKAIDHEVKKLTRVRFGHLTIQNLKEGEVEVLSIHDVKTLYALAKQSKNITKHKE